MEQTTTTAPPGLQLALLSCFELGKALRSGDADTFCELYDSLFLMEDPQDGANLQFKVSCQGVKFEPRAPYFGHWVDSK